VGGKRREGASSWKVGWSFCGDVVLIEDFLDPCVIDRGFFEGFSVVPFPRSRVFFKYFFDLMWMRFFWIHKIRKKRKEKAREFLCCNSTTEHYQRFKLLPAHPPPTIQAFSCCCWLWVVVFVVWGFWQFVLVCGFFCMCNLRFPKGVILYFLFFPLRRQNHHGKK